MPSIIPPVAPIGCPRAITPPLTLSLYCPDIQVPLAFNAGGGEGLMEFKQIYISTGQTLIRQEVLRWPRRSRRPPASGSLHTSGGSQNAGAGHQPLPLQRTYHPTSTRAGGVSHRRGIAQPYAHGRLRCRLRDAQTAAEHPPQWLPNSAKYGFS